MNTPATPAQAVTPGNSTQPDPNLAPTTPVAPATAPGGKVEIPTEEYARLQRNEARLKSMQRHANTAQRGTRPVSAADPTADPEAVVAEEVQRERQRSADLEHRLFERDVKDGVRELLEKPEFASLPESTKKLILRNPASFSEAQDAQGAIMDIEDFIREEVAVIPPAQKPPVNGGQPGAVVPPGHDTPPHVTAGSPSGAPAERLEDTSRLSGPERSRASLRNAFKRAKGVQG